MIGAARGLVRSRGLVRYCAPVPPDGRSRRLASYLGGNWNPGAGWARLAVGAAPA